MPRFKPNPPPVELLKYPGLSCGSYLVGPTGAMPTFVRHNDVAINFLERGRMQVLLSTGYRYVLGPGRLAFFWGAIPHKVEVYAPRTLLHWLVMPLGPFLRWTLPKSFVSQLMRGRVFFEPEDDESPIDLAMLKRW